MEKIATDVVAYLLQDKDIQGMRGVRLNIDRSCQSDRVNVVELMTVSQHELIVGPLLELAMQVRVHGDSRLASMAISAIAKAKGV